MWWPVTEAEGEGSADDLEGCVFLVEAALARSRATLPSSLVKHHWMRFSRPISVAPAIAMPPPAMLPVAAPTTVTTAVPPAMPAPPAARLPPPSAARPAELAAAPLRVPPPTPNPMVLTKAPILGAATNAAPPVANAAAAVVPTISAVFPGFSLTVSTHSSINAPPVAFISGALDLTAFLTSLPSSPSADTNSPKLIMRTPHVGSPRPVTSDTGPGGIAVQSYLGVLLAHPEELAPPRGVVR